MKNKIYIENDWLSGDTCVFSIHNPIERLQATKQISSKREEFVKKLENAGFNITFNKADITDDTICLVMDDTSLCEKGVSLSEYKKMFDDKIFGSAGEYFHYPFTLTLEKYFNSPFFPAVFKNEFANGGEDKFLIENQEQVEIIKTFYEQYYNIEPYKTNFNNCVVQQYLETPSKYATYLRVLVGGSGEVLGASLKYSTRTFDKNKTVGIFEKVFLDPNSKFFINANKMFNYYSGGGNIYFNQPRYSDEKTEV